ncbi:MAG: Rieske 2Fe-2S domain-containing protein [Moraxellaceae bacterium]|nr:Rieske 2Fe-2S domain-containing protein [Moraxellaceae bacterium]
MSRLICASEALAEGGDGVRFALTTPDGEQSAFVVRFDGKPRAYLNRCAHVAVELDWNPGKFFDDSGLYLICATHGALYEADTGHCAGGPCRGGALIPLKVLEQDGNIYLHEHE